MKKIQSNKKSKIPSPPSSVTHPALTVPNITNFIKIKLDIEKSQYNTWSELFKIHARAYQVIDHISPSSADDTRIVYLSNFHTIYCANMFFNSFPCFLFVFITGTIPFVILRYCFDVLSFLFAYKYELPFLFIHYFLLFFFWFLSFWNFSTLIFLPCVQPFFSFICHSSQFN